MQNRETDSTSGKTFMPSIFGLNDRASEIVAGAKKVESGEYARLFEASRPLSKYIFEDGRVYYEKVQLQRASICQFLALVDESGAWLEESFWTNTEISEIREFLGEIDPIIAAIESGELQEIY